MKKILLLLLFMSIPVTGYTKEIVPGEYIYIIDGKKVYYCSSFDCILVTSDYTKSK